MAHTAEERDRLRPCHPQIDDYPPQRLAKLEKAWRDVQAYQEAERERERQRPKPTEYLYDQTRQRRVRFGIDGRLEEEVPTPLLGWWPPRDRSVDRLVLGRIVERYGLLEYFR